MKDWEVVADNLKKAGWSFIQPSQSAAFDNVHSPGAATPFSGIYRSEGCGHEVALNAGNPLLPQNHHQHKPGQGSIRWRLVVFARTQ
jgi:hypothetical protein